jgi:hypothetical protein
VLGGDQAEDRFGHTNVEDPARIMFPNADEDQWRDRAEINGYLLKTIFPSLGYEYATDFDERIRTGKTFVYDRIVLIDRTAGMSGSKSTGPVKWYWKMIADVLDTPSTPNWWMPYVRYLLDEFSVAPTDLPATPFPSPHL